VTLTAARFDGHCYILTAAALVMDRVSAQQSRPALFLWRTSMVRFAPVVAVLRNHARDLVAESALHEWAPV